MERWARRIGLVTGLIAAAVAVSGWRMPAQRAQLGLELAMTYQPAAQLELSPPGRVLTGSGMEPGGSASGDLSVRNITGVTLSVELQALPSIPDLDRTLLVRLDAGGRVLYDGPLGALRAGARAPLRLASGATTTVHVTARLPLGATDGWRGRLLKVVLEPVATPVGG
jgi:hypothetical protein